MALDALSRSVRTILMHEWDPIGVVDEPAAQGEYDDYVSSVVRLLRRNASADDIYRHLRHLETDMIGLPGDAARTRRAAEVLASLSL
jgi:hypothetical protein